MAVTVATIDAAITDILDNGQSFTLDGQTYTKANLGKLIDLRDNLRDTTGRDDGSRPTIRGMQFGTMGY